MAEISVEKKFAVLCQIVRAQHFAWHQAVRELCPDLDMTQVVNRMWELTGVDTGGAYLKRMDPSQPLAEQVARSIVWSSVCMGEDARVEPGRAGVDEAFVRHDACPWFDWHGEKGLLAEDRPGCDRWFQSTVDTVNAAFGTRLRCETLETLPDGGCCCRRRFWREESSVRADGASASSTASDK